MQQKSGSDLDPARRGPRARACIGVGIAFPGGSGVFPARGLTTPDHSQAAAKRATIRAVRRPVAVAGHSRLGASYFARFGEPSEIGALITDSGIDDDLAAELESGGLRVVRA